MNANDRPPSRCVACHGTQARRLYVVRGYPIDRCDACGLARTELPPAFEPASIYTERYFTGAQADGYANYQASRDTLRVEFRRTVDFLLRHCEGGSLVELGCAYGYLLDEARRRFQVCGVEVSDHARDACRARGLAVARELTPDFVAAHGPFDAAVMLDVIEHLVDPGEMLTMLRGAMRAGGRLLLTTGDFGSLTARAAGRRWRLMTPPQHLWFFSASSLVKLLARTGFRVRGIDRPSKVVPLSLVAHQAFRMLGARAPETLRSIPGHLPLNLFDTLRVVAEPI